MRVFAACAVRRRAVRESGAEVEHVPGYHPAAGRRRALHHLR